MQLIHR